MRKKYQKPKTRFSVNRNRKPVISKESSFIGKYKYSKRKFSTIKNVLLL